MKSKINKTYIRLVILICCYFTIEQLAAFNPLAIAAVALDNEATSTAEVEDSSKRLNALEQAKKEQMIIEAQITQQKKLREQEVRTHLKQLLTYMKNMIVDYIIPNASNVKIFLANKQEKEAEQAVANIKEAIPQLSKALEQLAALHHERISHDEMAQARKEARAYLEEAQKNLQESVREINKSKNKV